MGKRETALVIGSGIAGLVAARVLSNHFKGVTVIDRDVLPETPTWRSGVPQAHHTHVLLNRGAHVLEGYFPGLQQTLADLGAPAFNFGREMKFRTYYGWAIRPFGDLSGRRCTRTMLEWAVRKKLRERPSVTFLPKTSAKGLLTEQEAVVGVETSHGELKADLVVEASGKASRMMEWVTELGYTFPKASVIDGHVGYATQIFKASPPNGRDWKGLLVQPAPDKPGGDRGGSLLPIENDQWSVTLTGFGGNFPPVEFDDYLEFARSFRIPDMYEALKSAEPVGHVYGSRSTENRHLHLERAKAWPKGFLALGDAVVHLNPVYAQGMTLASLECEALDRCLAAGDHQLPQRFYTALDKAIQWAWVLSTSVDLRVKNYEGDAPPPGFSITTKYMDRLSKLVCHYPPAARRFAEVIHLLRSPNSLMAPHILLPALVGSILDGRARESEAATA